MKERIKIAFDNENSYYKDNPILFIQLKEIIENHYGHGIYVHVIQSKKNIKLLEWINDSLPLLQDKKFNISTKCYWIMNDLHDFPQCLNCHKTISDKNVKNFLYGYTSYCSKLCQITSKEFKEQRVQTWRKNYKDDSITTPFQANKVKEKIRHSCKESCGVDYPMQNPNIVKKMQNTKQDRYGNKNYVNPDKAKQTKADKYGDSNYQNTIKYKETCRTRYGVDYYTQTPMWYEKYVKHSLETYGTTSPNSSDIVKQHRIEGIKRIYGDQYENISQVPEIRQKINKKLPEALKKSYETKRKNKTFNTSKPEEHAYDMLHLLHPHVLRQYSSEKYPFVCDFYDPESGTYYECNFSWTHGWHWFDENDPNDIARLELMKSKHSRYYDSAIETWTIRDVKKRRCAIENNLKYIVFWKEDEVRKYVLDELQKIASKM